MISRFQYLEENTKFLMVAGVICAILLLLVMATVNLPDPTNRYAAYQSGAGSDRHHVQHQQENVEKGQASSRPLLADIN